MRQSEPERLDHARHGGGRTHGHAVASGARHASLGVHIRLRAHSAGFQFLFKTPDCRPRADVVPVIFSVEHRATRNDQRRDVAARGPHDQGRRSFIAAAQQHHAVDRVPADRLFDIHADQIPEEHRRWPDVRLPQRHNGKLERQASGLPDAAFDVLGNVAKMRVAGRQFRPGVADADDGTPIKYMVGKSLVAHPAAMHKTVFVGFSKPRSGAILALLVRHEVLVPKTLHCRVSSLPLETRSFTGFH